MPYNPSKIEPKWQAYWDAESTFRTGTDETKPKYYVLDMFPYPSSLGLHVGHPEGYTATDIIARYKRVLGFNVLHPMGWDAFGLPAEQYALKTGIHPEKTTQTAIENFKSQLRRIGFSYDWEREVNTCSPDYYKWTQFLFIKLFEKGLAYQKEVPVNWCPELRTVLANEEVVDGKSERGSHPVFRVPMKQWMLKITAYAEKLLEGLDGLDWPESTKELQRNWIGKSQGLELHFKLEILPETLPVFTTRPDTLFGVTYLVLAPEHPLVNRLVTLEQKAVVDQYCEQAAQKSEITRQEISDDKTGVFTGSYALHPFTGEKIPVWISDYVLFTYGTGAVMGVPAHDERDHLFASTFDLNIKTVVSPLTPNENHVPNECYSGEGICTNSGFLTGKKTREAIEEAIQFAEKNQIGKRTTQYRLRDWLFSRQRYWGEPFPLIHSADGTTRVVPDHDLPIILPQVESYSPSESGESPIALMTDWVRTTDPKTGLDARRETDTMPGSAGSSWYFLRYCDPKNLLEPFSQASQKYWMPVDLYVGGPEHAVGHLLYSRFWTKVLFDLGMVDYDEPFKKLVHQGMIQGEDGEKMSKSRGNVINPDSVISEYGADTLRIYEMFMGPLDRDKPWSTTAIEGVYRFLQRTWRIFFEEKDGVEAPLWREIDPSEDELKITHKTIKKVTEDIEKLHFNTAVSQMMVFVNFMTQKKEKSLGCLKNFIQLLAPFAPHLAEELWEKVGDPSSLSLEPWPKYDLKHTVAETVNIAIQVMGKTRGAITVKVDEIQTEIERLAKDHASVTTHLRGKEIRKIIFVPNKIINFVVS